MTTGKKKNKETERKQREPILQCIKVNVRRVNMDRNIRDTRARLVATRRVYTNIYRTVVNGIY